MTYKDLFIEKFTNRSSKTSSKTLLSLVTFSMNKSLPDIQILSGH